MNATTFSALERFVPDDNAKMFDERFETYAMQKQYSRRQRALYKCVCTVCNIQSTISLQLRSSERLGSSMQHRGEAARKVPELIGANRCSDASMHLWFTASG